MDYHNIIKYCLDTLSEKGVDKSQCLLTTIKKHELNVGAGEISLLRTTFDTTLDITAIKDHKKGRLSINKMDENSINEGIRTVMELSETSNEDDSFDIASSQEPEVFYTGDREPNLDRMYEVLERFVNDIKTTHSQTMIEEMILTFEKKDEFLMNSNGVDFKSYKGIYEITVVFSSKEGEKRSSFNYTNYSMEKIEKDIIEYGAIKTLLDQSVEHIHAKPIKGKFVGDIVVTPDCLSTMISSYINTFLGDDALIGGSSVLKDQLNEKVASSDFTLHLRPVSEEVSNKYFITDDGFKSENQTIIEKGMLKAFVLSLYGANKTGFERAKNISNNYVVEAGNRSLEDMIKNVDKGILLCRYSGGRPSSSGDFSGVAKNSFYIENGEIKHPISETMVSGNLLDLFTNIKDISQERVNFGDAILPWICSLGITISGK
ncbi:TldD/PmbA family protein [Brassicibacter mesophilus]|uniref:TldD/PmbA family protein n=1 Tax=Brassicibacter mesophilus TaxID=745119 RepID=UPI003D22895E